jgi:hypothetical protein
MRPMRRVRNDSHRVPTAPRDYVLELRFLPRRSAGPVGFRTKFHLVVNLKAAKASTFRRSC